MKKNYVLQLFALFAGLMLLTATNVWGQGSESFVNLDASTGSYGDGSFIGNNGIEWSYNLVRKVTDAAFYITDPSAGFSTSGDRHVQATISGGIGSLEYKTRSYFTGGVASDRTIRVLVNGNEVDSYTLEAMGTVYTRTIGNIDVGGTFTLRFESTGTRQIIIDDIVWTGFVPEGDIPPSLGPVNVTDVGAFAAQLDGEVTSDGGAAVTTRGFVYAETSINADPIIDGAGVTKVPSEDGTGVFSEIISGLTPGTNYSVKAYATNTEGTSYSSVVSFNTLITLGVDAYTEDFEDFVSAETLPHGWTVSDDTYNGDWGTGFSGGLRGNDNVLGYQHTGTTGVFEATLTLVNNTGEPIEALEVSYLGRVERVAETRHPEWTVYVDGDAVPALSYSTAVGVDEVRSAVITGLNIANGESFTIVWSSDGNVGSAGSRRQIGIGDVSVEATEPPPVPDPVFSVEAGTYFEDQTVFISNFGDYDESVTIYYTLYGEDPDDDDTEYNNTTGILLEDGNGPITLKAIAIDNGDNSGIAMAVYTFPENVDDIAAFRAGDIGTLYRIESKVVVLHRDNFRNRHFVRDATGSLTIWDEEDAIEEAYIVGDGVVGFIGVKSLKNSNALIVLEAKTDPGEASDTGLDVSPVVVTLEDLDLDYTGNLVTIQDAEFTATGSFTASPITNYTFSDPSIQGTINFRTDFTGADYIDSPVPEEVFNLTVIVGGFGANPQVTARSKADFGITLTTWTGDIDNTWADDANWTAWQPGAAVNVVIPSELADYPTIDAAAEVNDLTIKSGASLLDNGNLTIHGDFIMEREISDGGFAWHFLSAPVSGMTIIGSDFVPAIDGEGELPNNFDFYAFDQSEELPWINIRGAGGMPNPGFETNFVPGKGYLVAYDDDYEITTFKFTGNMQTGSIDYPLAYTAEKAWSGWNLLGNPYPSAIQWKDAYAGQFAQNAVAIYDPNKDGGAGYVDIEEDGFIPANQGFFALVEDTEDEEDFTFTNTMRAHGGEFMKNDTPAIDQLKLRLAANGYWDETTIRIRENSEFSRDRQDAFKLFSLNAEVPQLYSKSSDLVQLSINSVPEIGDETVFPVGMRIPAEGEYTISLQELTGVFATESIYLTDLKLNKEMLLDANNPYTFTASPDDDPIRFKLHFSTMDDPTNIEDVDAPSVKLWYSNNTLYVNSRDESATVEVYDISGRRLQQFHAGAGEQSFRLNLANGVYIVRSTTHNSAQSMRIVVSE
ncbi:MAG: T9SS type A sorting domain-containing protein [Bacteroidales bacterium]|nr:T9SS type A sorting domain-containing protein [Bacteroidales bacterium]